MPNLSFTVYKTLPSILNIEIQAISQPMQTTNKVLIAPLRQSIFDSDQTSFMGKAWGQFWAVPMSNRLNALGGNTNLQLLGFECPSVDTTDMGWFATGTIDATTDPITVTAPITSTSMYGRKFAVGDYIIWNDPRAVNGRYQYEIDQITAVNGQVFTLSRSQPGAPAGMAYFGSVRAAHTSIPFFRMLDPTFYVLWDGSTQLYKFLWDKMLVSAASATTVGADGLQIVNLFPIPPTAAAMGLTTI